MSNWSNIYVRRKAALHQRLCVKPRFYLLLAALLLLAFGLSCTLTRLEIRRQERRIARLSAQKLEQETRLQALREAISFAQTDACVERIARSELNLLYPGEIRYIAATESSGASPPP